MDGVSQCMGWVTGSVGEWMRWVDGCVVGECTDVYGWMDDCMHGCLSVCVRLLLVVDLLGRWRGVKPVSLSAVGPLAWLNLP